MRSEELLCSLAALGWFALVGCHAPGSELESVRYGPAEEQRFDTFTVANINLTYEDEHGLIYTEISESGKYGEGFIGSARGVAVHIRAKGEGGERDHSGCTWPLLSATEDQLPTEPWIAVIRRGSCNFEIKVIFTETRGYSGKYGEDVIEAVHTRAKGEGGERDPTDALDFGPCYPPLFPGWTTIPNLTPHSDLATTNYYMTQISRLDQKRKQKN